MIRDSMKDEGYFKEYMAYEQIRISKFSEAYRMIPADQTSKQEQCLHYISAFQRNLYTAMYSAGYKKEELAPIVKEYLNIINQTGPSSYAELIDTLSLSILFDVSKEDIDFLLKDTDYQDRLICFMKDWLMEKWETVCIGDNLMYKEKYHPFARYADGELSLGNFIRYMKNEWYETNAESYWYDTHKSKSNTYAGYWCWLAAALLKIKGVASGQAECRFIPYELI